MKKVAIIGAGPAGIAMGVELAKAGVKDVVIFEKSDKDNASVRQFYPAGKDINSVYKSIEVPQTGQLGFTGIISLDQYHIMMDSAINDNSLDIKFNTEVQKITKKDKVFEIETSDGTYEAEYVVLASGVFAKPRKPDYKIPAAVLPNVSYDILNLQKQNITGFDILVVGGGDSASEYVQTLSAMGNNVSLSYRQDKIFRMNQLNIDRLNELLFQKKIAMYLGTNITSVEQDGDKIKVSFEKHDPMFVDKIVYSLGGASPTAFMANCGLEYDDTNVVLRDNGETSIDGLFMIGDLASGRKGGSIMLAFNGARSVMEGLNQKYGFPAPV
ncbi:MAG: hypothetical protein ATN35_05720 [Epulopiscium sp. Nele67-Bin004]|nr:MAG: hypothetical protein ATN35_05720 [Epulopiscium sp. Nele67-Bin004]